MESFEMIVTVYYTNIKKQTRHGMRQNKTTVVYWFYIIIIIMITITIIITYDHHYYDYLLYLPTYHSTSSD